MSCTGDVSVVQEINDVRGQDLAQPLLLFILTQRESLHHQKEEPRVSLRQESDRGRRESYLLLSFALGSTLGHWGLHEHTAIDAHRLEVLCIVVAAVEAVLAQLQLLCAESGRGLALGL